MEQQQQPQWSPPPQQPAGWDGAGMAPPPRPGLVTYAGVFLVVMGVLGLLVALLAFMGGALVGSIFQGDAGLFGGIFAFIGVIILVWALIHLAAGYGSLTGRNWGRITGLVVSVIAVVLGLLGLVGAMGGGADASGLVFQIVYIVLYGLAAWGLYQAGPYFAYRR